MTAETKGSVPKPQEQLGKQDNPLSFRDIVKGCCEKLGEFEWGSKNTKKVIRFSTTTENGAQVRMRLSDFYYSTYPELSTTSVSITRKEPHKKGLLAKRDRILLFWHPGGSIFWQTSGAASKINESDPILNELAEMIKKCYDERIYSIEKAQEDKRKKEKIIVQNTTTVFSAKLKGIIS